ncbi:unnamed protein product [Lactuca saligna]|uniref:Uncharacterized protein n=1 Tax=Lactuca saligna TaxID=75948 RepID=A0AA35ZGU9_LACSI|nr:unnamed protein product [Lactuca saligna]
MNIATRSSGPGVTYHHHQQNQMAIPIVPPPVPPPMPPSPNLPRSDLFTGRREDYNKIASAESTKAVEEFVENLVNLMEKNDLELQNKSYNTALGSAVAAGNVKIAMIMVKKNRDVIEIPGRYRTMPLCLAALFEKPDMVRYLYANSNRLSGQFWSHENPGWLLQKCVEVDIFDVAIKIVNDCPDLCAEQRLLTDVLLVLAQKTHAFKERKSHIVVRIIKSIFHVNIGRAEKESEALQLLKILWKKITKMPKSEIDDIIRGPPLEVQKQGGIIKTYPSQVLFIAAKMGNTRFIIELIRSYPDLIWKLDDKGQTIFHIAIKRRHAKIYNLLYEIGSRKDLITPIKDKNGNNMLHLVAKSAKPKRFQNVSGVAYKCNGSYYGSRRSSG